MTTLDQSRLQGVEADAAALSDAQLEKLARFHQALARDETLPPEVALFELDIALQLRGVLAFRRAMLDALDPDIGGRHDNVLGTR